MFFQQFEVAHFLKKIFILSILLTCSSCKNINLIHVVDTSESARGSNAETDFINEARKNCKLLAKYSAPNDFFEIIPATSGKYHNFDISKIRTRQDSSKKCEDFFAIENLKKISTKSLDGDLVESSTDACIIFERVESTINLTKNSNTGQSLVIHQIQVDDNLDRQEYCYDKANEFANFLRNSGSVMVIVGSENLSYEQHTSELFEAFDPEHRDVVKFPKNTEDFKDEIRKIIETLRQGGLT